MKTKLTLTVQKNIINAAKRMASKRNMSLSQLFEETFDEKEDKPAKTEKQLAAEQLLLDLKKYPSISTKTNDKNEIAKHVKRKFD